jgi:Na+-translocating ferredoxin:NAD+ oxidoreductase RnfD subunit
MLLEWIDARANHRELRFAGNIRNFINFLPACLIPGFACAMLLYANERLAPVVFAVVLSFASKLLLRAPVANGLTQHIFNPSNFGVGVTLLLFPEIGFAPPYHFTENITGLWDWAVPLLILTTGIIVHGLFTGRLPLVGAWILTFVAQALIRATIFGVPLFVPLMPMTSAAFIIFTLYMIPDPATTPLKPSHPALFGFFVAAVYAATQVLHLVFGLFYALLIVCAVRGIIMHAQKLRKREATPSGLSQGAELLRPV